MNSIALCPGSFDPITSGHLDVIERAASLYRKIIVGVAVNPLKKPLFSVDKRLEMAKTAIAEYCPDMEIIVDVFDSLLIDFARKHEASVIIKGLRAVTDFEHEFQMAQLNQVMAPDIETIFLMAHSKFTYLSSSAIKEIASYGGDVEGLVPKNVEISLREHFSS